MFRKTCNVQQLLLGEVGKVRSRHILAILGPCIVYGILLQKSVAEFHILSWILNGLLHSIHPGLLRDRVINLPQSLDILKRATTHDEDVAQTA